MAKRTLTAEQAAARDARRAKFAELARTIGAMSDDQRAAMAEHMGCVVTVEGRALSVHNMCLLAVQCPTVTVVGGFQQWIKAGRCVRKGEHGLMVWAPRMGAKDEAGQSEREGFVMVTVFDVSQTDELAAQAVA